ncbi:bacillithiol biosynthesis deacetylase BshB1 [bacterium]|nr:bacillithiol biosynthesis deacetylase BshB1 [bacterium]
MAQPEYLSDALFIGAHPDDGEILAGGLMASLAEKGRRVILADATRGEMGTRGTAELRAHEAAEAAEILGVERTNLGLPDGGIGREMEVSVQEVVRAIRKYRPRLVFTHSGSDHHPDHNALHEAVKRAFFLSNILKYDTDQERFKAARLLFFWSHREKLPPRVDFIADVSATYEKKIAALKAHRSQVAGTGFEGPETFLTGDLFWHRLHARFGYFGSLIGVRYGEPYLAEATLRIDDPLLLPDVT